MSVSLPFHASPLSTDADLTYSTLTALEELFRSDAPEKQLLWSVIRILARRITHHGPFSQLDPDLPVLLAVSVAIERAKKAGQ